MREAGGEIEVLCRMELSIPTLCDAFPEFYLHKQESDNLWPTPESIQYQLDLLISRKQQKMFMIMETTMLKEITMMV